MTVNEDCFPSQCKPHHRDVIARHVKKLFDEINDLCCRSNLLVRSNSIAERLLRRYEINEIEEIIQASRNDECK